MKYIAWPSAEQAKLNKAIENRFAGHYKPAFTEMFRQAADAENEASSNPTLLSASLTTGSLRTVTRPRTCRAGSSASSENTTSKLAERTATRRFSTQITGSETAGSNRFGSVKFSSRCSCAGAGRATHPARVEGSSTSPESNYSELLSRFPKRGSSFTTTPTPSARTRSAVFACCCPWRRFVI